MKNKILSVLAYSFSFLFLIKFSQGQSPNDCNKKLWDHVWEPSRLDVIVSCKTVTGTIVEKNADPDGDEHMLLKLDAGQDSLLRKKNYSKKNGNLVIEAICVNKITRKSAKGYCKSYSNSIALPKVGDHVQVTGSYVVDSHNEWTEIHPISTISILNK